MRPPTPVPLVLNLCPYLLRPTSDFHPEDVSDEHLIPFAVGGSDRLTIPANKDANSRFGRTTDSDLIHDPLVRLAAATQGIRSRSGIVIATLPGTVVETGDEMIVDFGIAGPANPRIKRSHRVDSISGKLVELVGFDSQVKKEVERLQKGSGKSRFAKTGGQAHPNPLVRIDIQSDSLKVSKGLAKIAYLMTCRVFGDDFILSQDAAAYRNAIVAADWNNFDQSGVRFLGAAELPFVVLPKITVKQHLLACFNIGSETLTTVSLFGGIVSASFALSAPARQLRNLEGTVIVNDAITRSVVEMELQEATPLQRMIQQMQTFHLAQATSGKG